MQMLGFVRVYLHSRNAKAIYFICYCFCLRYVLKCKLSIYYRPQTKFKQGNIFTSICHSIHRGEDWLPSMHHRSHDQGDLHPVGVCIQVCWEEPPPSVCLQMRVWADPPAPKDTWVTMGYGQ